MYRYVKQKINFYRSRNKKASTTQELLSTEIQEILKNTKKIIKKPQLNCDEQINNLKIHHKLTVINEPMLKMALYDYGYYRLMGYKKIFLNTYDIFSDEKADCRWGGTFEDDSTDTMLLNLVDFDIKLSSLILKNILKIEKLLKSRAAFFMADYYNDPYFYLRNHTKIKESKYIFKNKKSWIRFINDDYLKILKRGLNYNSNKEYMVHYKNKYYGNLPIWIYLKECSIGDFETFFNDLSNHPKLSIVERTFFSKSTYTTDLQEYVDAKDVLKLVTIIRHFRNRCAHGSRIYDFKYNFILKQRNNTDKDFMAEFTYDNKIYINDLVKFLSCFLREEDYLIFKDEYDEIIRSTEIFPYKYRDRLYKEIGLTR